MDTLIKIYDITKKNDMIEIFKIAFLIAFFIAQMFFMKYIIAEHKIWLIEIIMLLSSLFLQASVIMFILDIIEKL